MSSYPAKPNRLILHAIDKGAPCSLALYASNSVLGKVGTIRFRALGIVKWGIADMLPMLNDALSRSGAWIKSVEAMRCFVHRRALLMCLMMLIYSSSAVAQCDVRDLSMPQLDVTKNYSFLYFRLDALGRRKFCDEVSHILEVVKNAKQPVEKLSLLLDPIVVVFVHGWKHDGAADDEYVIAFRAMLDELANKEATGRSPRKVIGVYVGWPATYRYMPGVIENLTFWHTRDRADTIARSGEVSKLLNQLHVAWQAGNGILVTMGHSFGARLVFESVSQTLASNVYRDGAAKSEEDCHGNRVCQNVRGFGDLVVLLNPAFEVSQYHTFFRFSGGNWANDLPNIPHPENAIEEWPPAQLPLMLVVGAENDTATSEYWPRAHFFSEGQTKTTLTNYSPYITHILRCEKKPLEPAPALPKGFHDYKFGILDRTKPYKGRGCGILIPVGQPSNSPFIVARAERDLIDGHNKIWQPAFREFLDGYIEDLARFHSVRYAHPP